VEAQANSAALREREKKLLQAEGTIQMLEDKLQEKEDSINRLEQEKSKLESYAKRTLVSFKEKYMAALQGMKTEKAATEEQLAAANATIERNKETSQREERLILSAMYEMGLRIMDRKIQEQVAAYAGGGDPTTPATGSLLGLQRARLGQLTLGLGSPSPVSTAATNAALNVISPVKGTGAGQGQVTPAKTLTK
jgi:hypothetical protein